MLFINVIFILCLPVVSSLAVDKHGNKLIELNYNGLINLLNCHQTFDSLSFHFPGML